MTTETQEQPEAAEGRSEASDSLSDLLAGTASEDETLKLMAADNPQAGELYIKTTNPSWGEQREVWGRGTTSEHKKWGGVFLCCVGSTRWQQYAS